MSGPAPVIASMASHGIQPAAFFGYLIIFVETVGALCIVLGAFTRFFAAALAIESFVIAFFIQFPAGFMASRGGYEMVLTWTGIFIAIALRGGGTYSLDRKIGVEL
jgi:putative oxidoreductase